MATKFSVAENPNGRPVMKVVYVVLESQYQSSMTAAVKRINAGNDNMAVECVGYLLEELRNDDAYEQFKKDVEEANMFIGSLIFVQELAEKVIDVVKPARDKLDAVLVFPSMPEVMRLNKVGSFTMKNLGQSKSVVADFMKKKKQEDGSSFEEGMLKLLRTLPKVLKFLPSDKAADARTFMMSFQYWLGGELSISIVHCFKAFIDSDTPLSFQAPLKISNLCSQWWDRIILLPSRQTWKARKR